MINKPDARKRCAVSLFGSPNRLPVDRLGRRSFVTAFGAAAVSTVSVPKILWSAESPPRIGVIIPGSPPRDTLEAFRA
jgi:hypothetical protein